VDPRLGRPRAKSRAVTAKASRPGTTASVKPGRTTEPTPLAVGTSGFAYDHWIGRYYPRKLPRTSWLEFYAQTFSTVELNVTFYRMPKAAAFEGWRDAVPEDFRFAVKASRYLTHVRRLKDPRAPVEFLMDRATRLEGRLGPILLQLPPDMRVAVDRLDATLQAFGDRVQVAVEPRHPSWFIEEVRSLLATRGAALCLVDRRGLRTPLWATAPWAYVRFHEGRAFPPSCYGRAALQSWADRLIAGCGQWPEGYVYFNNDAHGCAVRNAVELDRLLRN
jgi:uncharacterized protein YecE (DUF72 family)